MTPKILGDVTDNLLADFFHIFLTHPLLVVQALNSAAAESSSSEALKVRGGSSGGIDVGLLIYFALWYLGNYYVSFEYRGLEGRVNDSHAPIKDFLFIFECLFQLSSTTSPTNSL